MQNGRGARPSGLRDGNQVDWICESRPVCHKPPGDTTKPTNVAAGGRRGSPTARCGRQDWRSISQPSPASLAACRGEWLDCDWHSGIHFNPVPSLMEAPCVSS